MFFQNIHFERMGEKTDSELKFEIETSIAQKPNEETYRVSLKLKGKKEQEYGFNIEIVGIFCLDADESCEFEFKKDIISKNTVAILMPYLRSEVSLLTAQPGMEPVVLPPFNINAMMDEK